MKLMRDIETHLVRSVDATVEPFSAPEVRQWIVEHADDQDEFVVEPLIKAARQYCENILDRALVEQTWKLYLSEWPDRIELRRPPILAVSSVTYVATDGDTETLATSVYTADVNSTPGLLVLKYGQSWPSLRGDHNGICVTFTAGYGDEAEDVPETIRLAMRQLIKHWYENREAASLDVPKEMDLSVRSLLTSEKWGSYS